ncbi:MAG: S8 family serine peptidase [Thermodesulfobacteriota bacterium]|nr:S8 family serine peptidase [Thermodesulfobacteriota bacterium]
MKSFKTSQITITTILTTLFLLLPILSKADFFQPPASENPQSYIIEFNKSPIKSLKAKPDPSLHIQFKKDLNQIEDRLREERSIINWEYHIIFNGLTVKCSKKVKDAIKKLPYIKEVHKDTMNKFFLRESVPAINADKLWEAPYNATGKGILVAVLDTGIDYTHPDLGGGIGPGYKVIGGYDLENRDRYPMDENGHGTHIAGIIAANGKLKGVAPEAGLLAYRFSGAGSQAIAGMEMAVKAGADIINMSFGNPEDFSPDDIQARVVDNVVDMGVVCVVAAGNFDNKYYMVTSPACARKAIAVGSTYKDGKEVFIRHSHGPNRENYQVKPEVVAPGKDIESTLPGGEYGTMTGTSMAAPHVAGACALILQMNPGINPLVLRDLLMNNGKDLGVNPYVQGGGLVDCLASGKDKVAVTSLVGMGFADPRKETFENQVSFQVSNLTETTLDFNLEGIGEFPAGVEINLNPKSFSLNPGETKEIQAAIYVNTLEAPYPKSLPYTISYSLELTSQESEDRIDLLFIRADLVELDVTKRKRILPAAEICKIYIYKKGVLIWAYLDLIINNGLKKEYYFKSPNHIPLNEKGKYFILLPPGIYDMTVHFMNIRSDIGMPPQCYFIIKENTEIKVYYSLFDFSSRDIKNHIKFPIYDSEFKSTILKEYQIFLFCRKEGTERDIFLTTHINPGYKPEIKISDFSENYGLLITAVGQNSENLNHIYMSDHLKYGLTEDYSPPINQDFSEQGVIKIKTDSFSPETIIIPQFGSYFPYITGYSPGLEGYMYLSMMAGFNITTIKETFTEKYLPVYFHRASQGEGEILPFYSLDFSDPVGTKNKYITYTGKTPMFVLRENQAEYYHRPWISGEFIKTNSLEADRIKVGLGPSFFSGRFYNTKDKIRIGTFIWGDKFFGPDSHFISDRYFFLNQSFDVHRQVMNCIIAVQDGSIVTEKEIMNGENHYETWLPWDNDRIFSDNRYRQNVFPVSPGIYQVDISYNYKLTGEDGTCSVEASFDTTKDDPNPPFFRSFHVINDGEWDDTIIPGGDDQITMEVDDDTQVDSVTLHYKQDGDEDWKNLPLMLIDGIIKANIPASLDEGFVHLKVTAEDTSGNKLEYTMEPGFMVEVN